IVPAPERRRLWRGCGHRHLRVQESVAATSPQNYFAFVQLASIRLWLCANGSTSKSACLNKYRQLAIPLFCPRSASQQFAGLRRNTRSVLVSSSSASANIKLRPDETAAGAANFL